MTEENKLIYSALNRMVCEKVLAKYSKVLDIGCGSGELGAYLKKSIPNRIVHGVTYSEQEYHEAIQKLDCVVVIDLNDLKYFRLPILYDCIICSHVLEHLYDPASLLNKLKENLTSDGILIVALPNVLFFKQRFKFLKGKFRYSETGGLMDVTHYRFFDWESAATLIIATGYKIISREADGYFPLRFLRKIRPLAMWLDNFAIEKFPGLFGCQFIIVASK